MVNKLVKEELGMEDNMAADGLSGTEASPKVTGASKGLPDTDLERQA